MDEKCIFCKIIRKELPSNIVYENEKVIAFPDINPKTPVHILIVPKEHIANINEVKDTAIFSDLFQAVKDIAEKEGIREQGYRIIVNTGKNGGQLVDHLHMHLLGGKDLGPKITG